MDISSNPTSLVFTGNFVVLIIHCSVGARDLSELYNSLKPFEANILFFTATIIGLPPRKFDASLTTLALYSAVKLVPLKKNASSIPWRKVKESVSDMSKVVK